MKMRRCQRKRQEGNEEEMRAMKKRGHNDEEEMAVKKGRHGLEKRTEGMQ